MSDDYRWILYPAILGFMLLALWIFELRARTAVLAHHLETLEDDADAVDNPAQ
jgi:hypothetical protein